MPVVESRYTIDPAHVPLEVLTDTIQPWHAVILLIFHGMAGVIWSPAEQLLIHDIVEIDAGDTYIYDVQGDKAERERTAADRIFGLLPADQAAQFRELWNEFESAATPEARFANALDRFIPQLHNYYTQGRSWKEHGITAERVLTRTVEISQGSETLWQWTQTLIQQADSEGLFPDEE